MTSSRALFVASGMFDGGAGAIGNRNDVTSTGSGSQIDMMRGGAGAGGADRRTRNDSESAPTLGGVFGVGVRSNSIAADDAEDDDVSVTLRMPYMCPTADDVEDDDDDVSMTCRASCMIVCLTAKIRAIITCDV